MEAFPKLFCPIFLSRNNSPSTCTLLLLCRRPKKDRGNICCLRTNPCSRPYTRFRYRCIHRSPSDSNAPSYIATCEQSALVQEEAKTSKSIPSTSLSASGSRIPSSFPPSFLLLPPLLPLPPSSSNIDKGEREEGRKEFPFPCSDSAKGQILSLLSPLSLPSSLVVVY